MKISWQPVETAPKDGTKFKARRSFFLGSVKRYQIMTTWWGKPSHLSYFGWCYKDSKSVYLWEPTEWRSEMKQEAESLNPNQVKAMMAVWNEWKGNTPGLRETAESMLCRAYYAAVDEKEKK